MTSDPKYLYFNKNLKELFTSFIYGINAKRGLMVIIGEVGTGKTTVLKALIDKLDKTTKAVLIYNTDLSFKQILILFCVKLGLTEYKNNLSMAEASQHLTKCAVEQSNAGGNILLIVDEAQNLNKSALENLRLLSNIETKQTKSIQIILSGQPKLDYKLSRPELSQLLHRISIKRYIINLNEDDTYNYIRYRLGVAGYKGHQIFNPKAMKLIWKNSEGVPLKINKICENSLMIGYATKKRIIDENIVKEAVRSITYSRLKNNFDYNYSRF